MLADRHAKAELILRWEDVAQDGRLRADALPAALGPLWRAMPTPQHVRAAFERDGVLPILTRLTSQALDGPFAVAAPLAVEGSLVVRGSLAQDGSMERVLLDMRAEVTGPKGRTNLPPPDDAGAITPAGTLFAEHVFTRPFAPPERRKVRALEIDGRALVPHETRAFRPAIDTLRVEGASAVDAELVTDPTPLPMGLAHSDSNQHVNSMVYPRLFEEAVLRRLHALGRSRHVLARSFDAAFRRPSFAGDVLHVRVRLYERQGGVVAVGAFFGEGEDDVARARVFVQMTLAEAP